MAGTSGGAFEIGGEGGASYSVPISLPPGTAGLQPRLMLSYDSQRGSGLLGVGWALAGLSSISRCPTTPVPDGSFDPVDFDGNDQFCLDGQRLIPTPDGFRTQIDTFQKVVAAGGAPTNPDSFTVFTKGGQILEFGGSADAKIEAQGRSDVLLWALRRVSDRFGNYYEVEYGEVNSQGFYAPLRVQYTGNDGAGLTPYNAVEFRYEVRSDPVERYQSGVLTSAPVRLVQVETYAEGAPARAYKIDYEYSPLGVSRIISIKECGFDSGGVPGCLSPTTFSWQDGVGGVHVANNAIAVASGPWLDRHEIVTGDFNGDGVTDLFMAGSQAFPTSYFCAGPEIAVENSCVAIGNGPHPWKEIFDLYPGDYNGDGFDDILLAGGAGQNSYVCTGPGIASSNNCVLLSNGPTPWRDVYRIFPADLNADGATDLLMTSTSNSVVCLGPGVATANNCVPLANGPTPWKNLYDIYPGDYNADGFTDIFLAGSSNSLFCAGPGIASANNCTFLGNGPAPWKGLFDITAGDFNGDGAADLFLAGSSVSYMCQGPGISSAVNCVPYSNAPSAWKGFYQFVAGDFNGDGVSDLFLAAPDQALADSSFCAGPGIADEVNCVPLGNGPTPWKDKYAIFPGDFLGDGSTDLFLVAKDNTTHYAAAGEISKPDLLISIANGIGSEREFAYAPLTDGSVYEKDSDGVLPVIDVQDARYVLAEVREDNGVGGLSTRVLSYRGLKFQGDRRLGLGFREIEELDVDRGLQTTTRYLQVFPRQGLASELEKRMVGSPNPLVSKLKTFSSSASGGVSRVDLPVQVEAVYELDGELSFSRVILQQFDAYGSPTVIYSVADDGISRTTTNQLLNDPASWLIGLPTRVEIKASAPGVPDVLRVTEIARDALTGRVMSETSEPGSVMELTRSLQYDVFGNETIRTVSGVGLTTRATSSQYDVKGRFPVMETNAVGHTAARFFDVATGNLTLTLAPNGLLGTFGYDVLGRLTARTFPDGVQSSISISECDSSCPVLGRVLEEEATSGRATLRTATDSQGRTIRAEVDAFDGRRVQVDTQFDALGREVAQSLPHFDGNPSEWMTLQYDALDRVVVQTEPDGTSTTFAYSGRELTSTNGLGQTRTEERDSQDRLLRVVDDLGGESLFAYDAFGNLISSTDPGGNEITAQWDVRGRRTQLTDPSLGTTLYQFDALGQLVQEENASGQVKTISYDVGGRVVARFEEGATTTWTYDGGASGPGVGQVVAIAGTQGGDSYSKTFQYDGVGRLSTSTTTINGDSYSISRSYDSASRLDRLTYPSGFFVDHIYNSFGYLRSVAGPSGEVYWRGDAQDESGQFTEFVLGNGLVVRRAFDQQTGALVSVKTGPGGSAAIQDLEYSVDALGNVTRRADLLQLQEELFDYDGLNRLTSAEVVGLAPLEVSYDAAGNILSKSDAGAYTYGGGGAGPHAVTSVQGGPLAGSFAYDDRGNQTTRFDSSGALVASLTYTAFNKPSIISAVAPSLHETSFVYDENRKLLIRRDTSGGAAKERRLLGELYESVLAGGVVEEERHYVRGADGTVALVAVDVPSGAETTRYPLEDHLGSIDKLTDESGAIVEALSFDPFGRRRNADWTPAVAPVTSEFPKGFGAHEQLDELGLIYMGARVYDPGLGRFVSPDPLVDRPDSTQGLNRYAYVENNPVTFTDPSGFGLRRQFKKLGKFFRRLSKRVGRTASTIEGAGDLLFCIVGAVPSGGAACGFFIASVATDDPGKRQAVTDAVSGVAATFSDLQDVTGINEAVIIGAPDLQNQWLQTMEPPENLIIVNVVETAFDLISLGLSLAEFQRDPSLLNGLFVAVDALAVAVPGVPGGAGVARKAIAEGAEAVLEKGAREGIEGAVEAGIKEGIERATAEARKRFPNAGKIKPKPDEGVIYYVPGSATPSGLPYIGRADDLGVRAAKATDNRDRSVAVVIDVYKKKDKATQGRIREQKAINVVNKGPGPIRPDRLDNRRNEIRGGRESL